MVRQKGPIRIVRIIARLNIGGPAIHAVSLSRIFSQGPYRSLLVCGRVGPREGDMSYLAGLEGVEPVFLPALGREISIADDVKSFAQVRGVIRKFKPHIVHTHTAKAGTVGRLGGVSFNLAKERGKRVRLVHTFHGHVFHDYFGPVKTRLVIEIERFLARFTDRIVAISPSQQNDICNRYRIAPPGKVRMVPLGFDLSPYMRKPVAQKTDAQGPFVVGIAGRLTHVKNHRLLLEAAKDIKEQGKEHNFRYNIIGDGELRDDLERYAKELELGSSVTFTGWRDDMPSVYRALDAVALTSLNEGTPVTLIEAMAAGLPVVATDAGGVKDLMGPVDTRSNEGYKLASRGILVPTGKRKALAGALLFASKNRGLLNRIAQEARSFVLREYSLERMTRDLDALYRELVQT